MIAGIVFFTIALICVAIAIAARIRWRRGLDRHLGEWFYDGEADMTFWRYFDGMDEILAEIDREFPGYRKSAKEEG